MKQEEHKQEEKPNYLCGEELQLYLIHEIKNKSYENILEAFIDYCLKNEIDLEEPKIKRNIMSASLYQLLYIDAKKQNKLNDKSNKYNLEDIF